MLYRCYGDTKHLRKLFPKALASTLDWPESIASAWINFERDEGSLEQLEICEVKVKECLEKIADNRKKLQEYNCKPQQSDDKKANKRKIEDSGKWKDSGASSSKVLKIEKPFKSVKKESSSDSQKSHTSNNPEKTVKSKVAPPPGYKEINEEKMEEDSQDFQKVDENITIFVSNLDYSTTEEEVREVLKTVAPITMFRMVKDFKGRSKGFCYVQLSSPVSLTD